MEQGHTLGIGWGRAEAPAVVVSNVGGESANLGRAAGVLVDRRKQLGSRGEVRAPAQPARVSSVEVHGNVRQVELLEGIVGAFKVGRLRIGASGGAEVGDQVCQAIGLNHRDDADVGEGNQLLSDGIDVRLIIRDAVVGNAVLAVGCRSRAVAIGKIVNDELPGVRGTRALCSLRGICDRVSAIRVGTFVGSIARQGDR